jgi:hypothetical protein
MKQVKNPHYSKPWDKHCSNCVSCLGETVGHWCSEFDDPIHDEQYRNHFCKHWKWKVPKYIYVEE